MCDHFEISDTRAGETLRRWKIAPDEVVLADRAYSHREAVSDLMKIGANFVVRLNAGLSPLEHLSGRPVDLGSILAPLKEGNPRSWKVFVSREAARYSLRLCAVKKSVQAATLARKKVEPHRRSTIQEQTLLVADYLLVLTSLSGTALFWISTAAAGRSNLLSNALKACSNSVIFPRRTPYGPGLDAP